MKNHYSILLLILLAILGIEGGYAVLAEGGNPANAFPIMLGSAVCAGLLALVQSTKAKDWN